MNDIIVVIERDSEAPLVVRFDTEKEANVFVQLARELSEETWSDSFHNYPRDPVTPMSWQEAADQIRREREEYINGPG